MDPQLYRYSFTDTSSNSPTSWLWDFGDGATSKDQNPTHNYSTPGTYTVTLTASNSAGSDDEVKTNFITVVVPVIDLTTITNNGGTDASTFVAKLYNNTQIQKITLTGLTAGQSTTITFNWTPTTGNHTITVIADANKQITETSENNNQITTNTP